MPFITQKKCSFSPHRSSVQTSSRAASSPSLPPQSGCAFLHCCVSLCRHASIPVSSRRAPPHERCMAERAILRHTSSLPLIPPRHTVHCAVAVAVPHAVPASSSNCTTGTSLLDEHRQGRQEWQFILKTIFFQLGLPYYPNTLPRQLQLHLKHAPSEACSNWSFRVEQKMVKLKLCQIGHEIPMDFRTSCEYQKLLQTKLSSNKVHKIYLYLILHLIISFIKYQVGFYHEFIYVILYIQHIFVFIWTWT